MGDMKEDVDVLKEMSRQKHDERVQKTPNRIDYAIQQFEKNDIEYVLKNPEIGHFHCQRKSDDKLFQFWASTGKIMGCENRGIHFLIEELLK